MICGEWKKQASQAERVGVRGKLRAWNTGYHQYAQQIPTFPLETNQFIHLSRLVWTVPETHAWCIRVYRYTVYPDVPFINKRAKLTIIVSKLVIYIIASCLIHQCPTHFLQITQATLPNLNCFTEGGAVFSFPIWHTTRKKYWHKLNVTCMGNEDFTTIYRIWTRTITDKIMRN